MLSSICWTTSLHLGWFEEGGDKLAVDRQQAPSGGGFRVVVKRRLERVQQKTVGVGPDGKRLRAGKDGVGQIDVDIGEALLAPVSVGERRRDYDDVMGAVVQGPVLKDHLAAAAGAVDQFPVSVDMAGDGPGEGVLSHVDDVVHIQGLPVKR